MVESIKHKSIDKRLEEFRRTATKYQGKNEFDYADMDDLRNASRIPVSLRFDLIEICIG